jgi:hypothetical protein
MMNENSFVVCLASTETERESMKALKDYFEAMYFAN